MKISRLTPVLGRWLYRRTVRKWVTEAVSHGDKNAVRELVAVACSPDDNVCRDTATRGLSSLVHPQAIDCFCEEVVRRNDARLTWIAQECRYAPTGEPQRALFFLGTGEMDSFSALDPEPEHPLLARGYAMADRGVKEGVCAAVIASKNAPILADVLATGSGRRTSGWNPAECEVLITGRMQESRGAELWRELFAFPPSPAVQALHALRDSGFVPAGDELTPWLSLMDVLPDTWTFPVPGHKTTGTIGQPQGQPLRRCFSPQGDLLATSGPGGTIRVRDVRSGAVRCSVHAGTGAIRALVIAGNPQRLVCIGDDMAVRAWDIESGHPCWELPGTNGGPGVFCIAPAGNRLFIGSDEGEIRSIDTTSGEITDVAYRHFSPICCLSVSPDGRMLVCAGQDTATCVIDPGTGTVLQKFSRACDTVRGMEITPDNQHLIIIGNHPRPVMYDTGSGKRVSINILSSHRISQWSLSPNGRIFSWFSEDRRLRFLHIPDRQCQSVEVNGCDITACVTTHDNATLIAGCSNGRIRFYPVTGGTVTRDFLAHKGPVTSLVCSPDGRYLASCGLDGMIKLWNMDTGALVRIIADETGEVTCLSGTLDGSVLFAGSTDGTVRVFDRQDGNLVTTRDMFTTAVLALALSPDGTVLACAGGDHTLRFWNRNDGSMINSCEGLKHNVRCLAFSPDGSRLVSGGWDGNVRCWQVPDGSLLRIMEGHTSIVTACAISPDGRVLATGSNDTTIRLRDIADGRLLRTMDAGRTEIGALAMSHDGKVLASGEKNGSIRLFCLPGGNSLGTVEGIPGKVTALLVSKDDQALIAGYDSGILAVYSLDTRRIISSVPAHSGAITGLVMVPDADMVVSAGRDGKIRQWDLPWTKPLAATTPADISRVALFAQAASSAAKQAQWEFLERLLKCRFNNEIGICTNCPLAGVYDIQIVG